MASLQQTLQALDSLQSKVCALRYCQRLTAHDSLTLAPVVGSAMRSEALARIYGMEQALLADDAVGELLRDLDEHTPALDAARRAQVRVLVRAHREATLVPADLAADYKRLTSMAFPVWVRAKNDDDFASFEPYLARIFELLRAKAAALDPASDPYDVMLDGHEHGCDQALCDSFFHAVRQVVTPLVRAIAAKGDDPAPAWTRAHVGIDVQRAITWDVWDVMGIDRASMTLGATEHPFTSGISPTDVRIAHHYHVDRVLDGVATSMHEGGHALYEQGIDRSYFGTLLEGGASGGIHESQSRLMENMVGHCRSFSGPLLSILRAHAPEVYADVTADELYRAQNRVHPGLIRTESDELTYPLHVMVRYEAEKAMMSGALAASDVPTFWNDAMRDYLGVEVPDDAHGCLQDMHWASDFVGYFPGYALGNAYAAQFVAGARAELGDALEDSMAAGDLNPLVGWLRGHVWVHGASLEPADVISGACGGAFDPTYYTDYLKAKFGAIYGL